MAKIGGIRGGVFERNLLNQLVLIKTKDGKKVPGVITAKHSYRGSISGSYAPEGDNRLTTRSSNHKFLITICIIPYLLHILSYEGLLIIISCQ